MSMGDRHGYRPTPSRKLPPSACVGTPEPASMQHRDRQQQRQESRRQRRQATYTPYWAQKSDGSARAHHSRTANGIAVCAAGKALTAHPAPGNVDSGVQDGGDKQAKRRPACDFASATDLCDSEPPRVSGLTPRNPIFAEGPVTGDRALSSSEPMAGLWSYSTESRRSMSEWSDSSTESESDGTGSDTDGFGAEDVPFGQGEGDEAFEAELNRRLQNLAANPKSGALHRRDGDDVADAGEYAESMEGHALYRGHPSLSGHEQAPQHAHVERDTARDRQPCLQPTATPAESDGSIYDRISPGVEDHTSIGNVTRIMRDYQPFLPILRDDRAEIERQRMEGREKRKAWENERAADFGQKSEGKQSSDAGDHALGSGVGGLRPFRCGKKGQM